ncbi:MAG: hypothetical protein O9264_17780 [Leptospira sp.]|nr:hypothetical protein [Leptospira sp.]
MNRYFNWITFFLSILIISCNKPDFSNGCDIFSKSFLEALALKSLFNQRSPHCGFDFSASLSPPKPFFEGRERILDYIKNDGNSIFTASNTACEGTETGGYSSCLHAGLMISVELQGGIYSLDSCDGYSARDNFDTLQFSCFERQGGGLVFVATSLKRGKFLGDLVLGSTPNFSFKPMKISVFFNGELLRESKEAVFWKNKILPYPDAGGSLSESGTLYLMHRSTSSLQPSQVIADKIGILFQSNIKVSAINSAPFFQFNGKFQYIEGDYHSIFTLYPFTLIGSNNRFQWVSNFTTVMGGNSLEVRGSQGFYQYLKSSMFNNGNSISVSTLGLGSLTIRDNTFFSAMFGDADATVILVRAVDSGSSVLNQSFVDMVLYSATDESFFSDSDTNSILSGLVLKDFVAAQTGNSTFRISIPFSSNRPSVLLSNFVSANYLTGNAGIVLNSSTIDTPINFIFENGAFLKENNLLFFLNNITGSFFTGQMKVGIGSTCSINASAPGLSTDCSPSNGSDFSLTRNIAMGESFVGSIFVDDKVNEYDTNGASTSTYPNDAQYLKFESPYRSYNLFDAAGQFTEFTRGICSGNCRIFDWSVRKTDSSLRYANVCPDATKPLMHIIGGSATSFEGCQLLLKGSQYLGSNTCRTFHLRNAREILGDGKGNENGLCESNEECLYTPNLGAYQGHGTIQRAYSVAPNRCPDLSANASGELKNIKLYQYSENGY